MSTPPPAQFRSQSEMIDYLAVLENRLTQLEDQNQQQLTVIETLQSRPLPVPTDTHLPKTNLLNPNFLKRAFAVWGHYFVAQLMIGLVIAIIYLVILLVFFAAGNFLFPQ
jgi:hypothetical protein